MSNIVIDMSPWTVRKTPDNKVSVVDVIAHIRGVTTKYAATMYRRLCDEDRVPKCATEPLPPRADSLGDTICTPQQRDTAGGHVSTKSGNIKKQRGGFSHASQDSPVATAAEMVEIIWALPGNAEFRRNCARIAVRYLGGDETMIDEIRMNRRAQECLAETNPEHPARVFGAAVENEQVAHKRTHLDITELDEKIKASKRRCIEDGIASLQRCGLPIDDRDRIRAKDCLNQITFGAQDSGDNPAEQEICIREVLSKSGIRDPKMDSKVGREAKRLYLIDHPNYVFPKKNIYVNGQMLPANVWYLSQRSYVEQAVHQLSRVA